jgi:hypothetical protein
MHEKYFDSDEQQNTFVAIGKGLIEMGAVKVGLSGSRAAGKQHEQSDVDIIALLIDSYCRKLGYEDKFIFQDCELPNGTYVPKNFQVVLAPYHSEGGKIAESMKAKAIWLFTQQDSYIESCKA